MPEKKSSPSTEFEECSKVLVTIHPVKIKTVEPRWE
jgi:hypothetical protein